jgi:spermidine synthase
VSITLEGDWLIDESKRGEVVLLKVARRLHAATTSFQRAEIVETETFGRALVLDGALQSCAKDEYIYHESLVHPALISHPDPKRVAILGGGEGATLREVLRHRTVESVTMVDIDPEVVKFCREHLPSLHSGSFEDPRSLLVYADARAWVADQPQGALDVVIVDISEPIEGGPACLLFAREFYQEVHRALGRNGVMLAQTGAANLGEDFFFRVFKSIDGLFERSLPLISYVDSYSDLWGFVHASRGDSCLPPPQEVDARLSERGVSELRYYDGETHRHMVSLPLYLRAALEKPARPFTDQDPPSIKFERHKTIPG